MENGEETFASPTAAAAEFDFDFGQPPPLTNGAGTKAAAYDVGEMDALREAKRDLEERLAAARHENGFLSAEAARLEMQVAKARDDIAAAERAAADAEGQAAALRTDVKRLQGLLAAADASDRGADGPGLGGALATAHQEKLALEEEIKALKASAAADKEEDEEEETAAPSANDGLLASHATVAAAAAAGAAATAAIAVLLLHLKR
ncbi:uncharacterized protein LOC124649690 [Lolium rigidum]|uniref:uncharacterized protein LOC124649690 n=1 Tax=Lolium rigidum TaxID=89674 RepID=UPI001F5CAA0D|nr:uncharacterized protein LOC124649690 [Lolium rigidum]